MSSQRFQEPQATYGMRLERFTKQREEWKRSLQMIITPAVEQYIRNMYRAAEICTDIQPHVYTVGYAFSKILGSVRTQSDAELKGEIGEKRSDDAEVCLQMIVRSHATVLALATARRCKKIISVPTIVKFFRSVLEACVAELPSAEHFTTNDIDMRAKVRHWIDQIVSAQALAIVPVGMFAKTASAPDPEMRKAMLLQQAIERAEIEEDPTVASSFPDTVDQSPIVVNSQPQETQSEIQVPSVTVIPPTPQEDRDDENLAAPSTISVEDLEPQAPKGEDSAPEPQVAKGVEEPEHDDDDVDNGDEKEKEKKKKKKKHHSKTDAGLIRIDRPSKYRPASRLSDSESDDARSVAESEGDEAI